MTRYEIAVIGGGIVGLATALALHERGAKSLIVLEAEGEVATHQIGHNSGVIHSGLYYKPGSLKATLCTGGRRLLLDFCAQEGIAHETCGKLVVALDRSELPRLDALAERGAANGLALRRLAAGELKEYEPHVAGVAGLWIPETGIVNYRQVAGAFERRLAAGASPCARAGAWRPAAASPTGWSWCRGRATK